MSDLATLNKSVSLSSASHDFVLLAKSLGRGQGWHFRDGRAGPVSPVDARARSLVGFEIGGDADVAIDSLGAGTVSSNGYRVFR